MISAQKQEGKLKWVKIFSEKGGELRLKNPFPNKEISFQERTDYTWKGDILLINTKPGEMALIKEKE